MSEPGPLLDQASSAALGRLAAQRGLFEVHAAGEDVVRERTLPRWRRWLPYFFFCLSLFSLVAMALGMVNLADDGWTLGDGVQVVLLALLVFGVSTQSWVMLRSTRPGRWLRSRLRRPRSVEPQTPTAASPGLVALDAVSTDDLVARQPATHPGIHRRARARQAGARWSERLAVIVVVLLALLALLGMLFVAGYIAYEAGPSEPALWITIPFTAITAWGTFNLVRAARRAAFRGRPFALFQRAFRDSVRVWGSGSLALNVLFASAAAGSIGTAAIAPLVAPADAPFDLFMVDQSTGDFFRVDLATNTSYQVGQLAQARPLGAGSTSKPLSVNGTKVPRGSLVAAIETRESVQVLMAVAPGTRKPMQIARVSPALPGASFAAGGANVFALQPDGTLWTIDPRTGAASRVAVAAVRSALLAYDASKGRLLALEGGTVSTIDPATGEITGSRLLGTPDGFQACGFTVGAKGNLWVAEAATGHVYVSSPGSGIRVLQATGDVAARPCTLALALRN